MLKELEKIRQHKNEPFRRWFWSLSFDLIMWYDEDERPVGFQLCYRKENENKVLTWNINRGFSHDTIDDEEGDIMRYKKMPILIPDGVFNKENMVEVFKEESLGMEKEMAQFVLKKLQLHEGRS